MKPIAFLFPGQGSQYVGMGKELFENFSLARQVFEEANDALHFSISKLCFQGPGESVEANRKYAARDSDRKHRSPQSAPE